MKGYMQIEGGCESEVEERGRRESRRGERGLYSCWW